MTAIIAEKVKITFSKVIYDDMITSSDVDDAPFNGRVVTNKKYYDRMKERQRTGRSYRVTFADEIQSLCSMVANDDFVRSVTLTSARVAQIVLAYTATDNN